MVVLRLAGRIAHRSEVAVHSDGRSSNVKVRCSLEDDDGNCSHRIEGIGAAIEDVVKPSTLRGFRSFEMDRLLDR